MRMLVLVQTPLQEPVEMMEYALLWVQVQLPVQAMQVQEESLNSELLRFAQDDGSKNPNRLCNPAAVGSIMMSYFQRWQMAAYVGL